MGDVILGVERLGVSTGKRPLIDDIGFNIANGEALAVFGPSGAGKSTILNSICGILPDSLEVHGRIFFNGEDITVEPPEVRGLKGISLVPQNLALFPLFDAIQNIAYPLRCRGVPKKEAIASAAGLAERFGLKAVADHRPNQLSGGQQQRVALARALAGGPKLLLLDEPLKGLDDQLRDDLLILLEEVKQSGVSLLLVTHNRREVTLIADRVVFLDAGRLTGSGPTDELIFGKHQSGVFLGDACVVPGIDGDRVRFVSARSLCLNCNVDTRDRSGTRRRWQVQVLSKRPISPTRCALLLEFEGGTRTWWDVQTEDVASVVAGGCVNLSVEYTDVFRESPREVER